VWIESSDEVQVAVHEFGGTGRPLFWSHATGFHAHCYEPIARRLGDHFTSFGLDHRGHGDDWQVDWSKYGDDARVAAEAIAPDGGLVAFGHSMGGASLVMAAHTNPGLFETLVVFEPIIFPAPDVGPQGEPTPMIAAARNRRSTFDSYEAAIERYASKPPMQFFDADILRAYVEHGFTLVGNGCSNQVGLRCAPEHEARTFETGGTHGFWDVLPEIETKVIVVSGRVDEERSPAGIAASVAERLPNGSYIELPDGNHLTPFIAPDVIADLLRDTLG
jgi:pimeloyl-ACP methyl ester carboxylesterase